MNIKSAFAKLKISLKGTAGQTRKTQYEEARKVFGISAGTWAEVFFKNWYDAQIRRIKIEVADNGSVVLTVVPGIVSGPLPRSKIEVAKYKRRKPRKLSEEQLALAAQYEQEIAARGILNFMLPNGKRIKECTAGELRAIGGWLCDLTRGLADNVVVGTVLSHEQAQRRYDAAMKNKGPVA